MRVYVYICRYATWRNVILIVTGFDELFLFLCIYVIVYVYAYNDMYTCIYAFFS